MPPNTVSVTRPGPYGNPFRVGGYFMIGDPQGNKGPMGMAWCEALSKEHAGPGFTLIKDNAQAVDFFKRLVATSQHWKKKIEELRGKNLACFCPLHIPCHADVLLELANR